MKFKYAITDNKKIYRCFLGRFKIYIECSDTWYQGWVFDTFLPTPTDQIFDDHTLTKLENDILQEIKKKLLK